MIVPIYYSIKVLERKIYYTNLKLEVDIMQNTKITIIYIFIIYVSKIISVKYNNNARIVNNYSIWLSNAIIYYK